MLFNPSGTNPSVDGRAKAIFQVLFGIAAAAAVLIFNSDIRALGDYGYAGVFLISALSSATLFIPAPGWAVVASMATILNPFLIGLAAGTGSAIGELTGYMVGDGAISLAHRKKFEEYLALIRKNDALAIIFFSFLPNPFFDLAGIASGAAKVPVWRYLLFCALGRSARYILLAWLTASFIP